MTQVKYNLILMVTIEKQSCECIPKKVFKFWQYEKLHQQNRYMIYSQWWFNLIKTYRTPLEVEMNAKYGKYTY